MSELSHVVKKKIYLTDSPPRSENPNPSKLVFFSDETGS